MVLMGQVWSDIMIWTIFKSNKSRMSSIFSDFLNIVKFFDICLHFWKRFQLSRIFPGIGNLENGDEKSSIFGHFSWSSNRLAGFRRFSHIANFFLGLDWQKNTEISVFNPVLKKFCSNLSCVYCYSARFSKRAKIDTFTSIPEIFDIFSVISMLDLSD